MPSIVFAGAFFGGCSLASGASTAVVGAWKERDESGDMPSIVLCKLGFAGSAGVACVRSPPHEPQKRSVGVREAPQKGQLNFALIREGH